MTKFYQTFLYLARFDKDWKDMEVPGNVRQDATIFPKIRNDLTGFGAIVRDLAICGEISRNLA